jgi:hypothetical protein
MPGHCSKQLGDVKTLYLTHWLMLADCHIGTDGQAGAHALPLPACDASRGLGLWQRPHLA